MTHPADAVARLAVTPWGAARSVTGSLHLVEVAGHKVLLDCGLERAHFAHRHHLQFPFAPAELHALILSHAHIDHCGSVPGLVRQGFAGPIYCTSATKDLVGLMLFNSARFHEEEAFLRQVIGGPAGAPPRGEAHALVDQVLHQCVAVGYDEPHEVAPGVTARLVNAGHVLGSAMVHLSSPAGRVLFTGDLGRRGAPLLPDPAPLPEADLVLSESTYGGRRLEPVSAAIAELEAVARRTLERGGKVLVPAFSLGRTQVLTHVLIQAIAAGRVPAAPVYVDSPLAADIAEAYRRHPEALDEESARQARAGGFLYGPTVRYVQSAEESRHISTAPEPHVVIAAGGMCEGGRILQHVKAHVDDPRSSIVLVSYQAPQTPGRRLLERGPTVRLHGRKFNKWAEVLYLAGFSGHADHDDLLSYLGGLAGRPVKLRLVHGEPEQAALLRRDLLARGLTDVEVPERGRRTAVD